MPPLKHDDAVSITSHPASTALTYVINARPVVLCVCKITGRSTAALIAFTRSYASCGPITPAISLIQIE